MYATLLVLMGSLCVGPLAKATEPFVKIIAADAGFETYVYKKRLISGKYLLSSYAATFCYRGTFADVKEIIEAMVALNNARGKVGEHSTAIVIERLEPKLDPTYSEKTSAWIELELLESTVNLITGGAFEENTIHRGYPCSGP